MLLRILKFVICLCDIVFLTLIASYMNSEDGKNLEKSEYITFWVVTALMAINVLLILT